MNKTVLITGSSSGIGKATAKFFQEKGWNVVATMRTPDKEEELTKLDNVLVTRLDVLDHESITSAMTQGIEKFGKIDVVVNNAGYGAFGPLEAFPAENIKRQFDVNVIGLLDVTQQALAHFRANKSGMIINISSIGGKMTMPMGALYHGTKFAVEGISEALTYELAQIGAQIKIVEPGAIKTDFGGRSFDFRNDESLTEYQEFVKKVMDMFGPIMSKAADARVCAEVIFEAATDGKDQLRYTAGEDARQMMTMRREMDDAQFMQALKSQFGL